MAILMMLDLLGFEHFRVSVHLCWLVQNCWQSLCKDFLGHLYIKFFTLTLRALNFDASWNVSDLHSKVIIEVDGFLARSKWSEVFDCQILFSEKEFNSLSVGFWVRIEASKMFISIIDSILWPFHWLLTTICLNLDGRYPFIDLWLINSHSIDFLLLKIDIILLLLHMVNFLCPLGFEFLATHVN